MNEGQERTTSEREPNKLNYIYKTVTSKILE